MKIGVLAVQGAFAEHCKAMAVSYTHLTLPTIWHV